LGIDQGEQVTNLFLGIMNRNGLFQYFFRIILLVALLFTVSCSKKPNVILIMADDMGHECLSSYGGISYSTPNLDRLAREGMLFTHCIAQPLCTPSRVKLMTGLHNYRNYEYFGYLDTAWMNTGRVMKEAGYRTCIAGKWQLNGLACKDQIGDWDDASRSNRLGYDRYCR
jgi:arylsulfatase A